MICMSPEMAYSSPASQSSSLNLNHKEIEVSMDFQVPMVSYKANM